MPEPPLELVDERDVRDWIERATAQLLFRRDRHHLLREALQVLEEEWRTAMTSMRLRERAARQQERLVAERQPGYWRARDARRQATRPVHVVVDPVAWDRAKAAASARRSSVGVVVGELVLRVVRQPQHLRCSHVNGEMVRLFTRVAVDDDSWRGVRAFARAHGITVERFIGIIVEDVVPSERGQVRPARFRIPGSRGC